MRTSEAIDASAVTAVLLIITRFKLLYLDWRGYLIADSAMLWVANVYLGIIGRICLDLRMKSPRKKRYRRCAWSERPVPPLRTVQD